MTYYEHEFSQGIPRIPGSGWFVHDTRESGFSQGGHKIVMYFR